MRIIYLIVLLLGIKFCPQVTGQNLIPNYSFEDTMPRTIAPLYGPTEWTYANMGSPDYFSPYNPLVGQPGVFFSRGVPLNVVGYQNPKFGIAYMGLVIGEYAVSFRLREYLQARFKKNLNQRQYLLSATLYQFSRFLSKSLSKSICSSFFQNKNIHYDT